MLTTRRLATAVLFAGLFAITLGVLVDSETFWHLRAGVWMLDHGRLMDFDAFSHTVAGRAWVNHSWASEIVMALVYRGFGYAGLNVAAALAICGAMLVVYSTDESDSYVRGLVVALAALTTAIHWSAGPHIVSLLMIAIFHGILLRWRLHGENRLWLLPPLMAMWVNVHGGFAIGFLLLGVTGAGEAARWLGSRLDRSDDDGTGRRSRAPLAWIAGVGAACLVAAAVNPWGFDLLGHPVRSMSMGVAQNWIQEWKSPDFHSRSAQFFIAFWLVAFGVVGASRRRIDVTDFLTFALFSGMALFAARDIPVFAVIVAPLVMRHAGEIVNELKARWAVGERLARAPRAMVAANWVVLALVMVAIVPKASLVLGPGATEREVARAMPVGAVHYLRTRKASGRLFNTYDYGGFLAWSLDKRMPVYVDGRTDLYDDAFLEEYINAWMAGPGWERTLAKYQIGVVLVEPGAPIARALLATPEWSLEYRDQVSVVLVKRTA